MEEKNLFDELKQRKILEVNPDQLLGKQENILADVKTLDGDVFKLKTKKGRWITDRKFQDSTGEITTTDINLVCFEVHNMMNEPIYYTSMLREDMGLIIEVMPDKFALIPHKYMILSCKSGRPITVKEYYGKDKFKHGRR